MPVQDFPLVHVAVALVMKKEREILWTINKNWGAFALPMTKRRLAAGQLEPADQAAARAGAEVLGVPVIVGARWAALPELKLSGRDGAVRRYAYEVFRVEPHPDFAHTLGRPDLLWLTEEHIFGGVFRPPVSSTSAEIVTDLMLEGRIPRRTQQDGTVIFQRLRGSDKVFLLRWNPDWGFALPSKRKQDQEPAHETANRVLTQELQLVPGTDTRIRPSAIHRNTTFSVSRTAGIDTFYVHWLFDGEILGASQPQSSEAELPLVWASKQQMVDGKIDGPPQPLRPGKAQPGKISPTVIQILSALDYVSWINFDNGPAR